MQRREVLRLLGAAAVPALALTPGRLHALGASVARFIEVIVGDWDAEADRATLLAGQADPDQVHVLSALEAEARIAPSAPAPFFLRTKSRRSPTWRSRPARWGS